MAGGSRLSLFSQRFDRAVLASYFLGGVLPIAALFFVVREFVLPQFEPGSFGHLGWLAGVFSLAILSLAVTFALRRISDATLSRMRGDNQRLATLLAASRELSASRAPEEICASAGARARELTGATHAALLIASDPAKPLELRHADPDSRAWFEADAEALLALGARQLFFKYCSTFDSTDRGHIGPVAEALMQRRFAIIQVWRAINRPIASNPLAIADAASVPFADMMIAERRYPTRIGQTYRLRYGAGHRWFYFPLMRRDEALVFKVFDSATDGRARFTGHTSFEDPTTPPGAPPRQSIEARALVFF